jgi:hypothetical protein
METTTEETPIINDAQSITPTEKTLPVLGFFKKTPNKGRNETAVKKTPKEIKTAGTKPIFVREWINSARR